VRGEPIVCTTEDSWRCFMRTGMDALVLETFVLDKEGQPEYVETESWTQAAGLD
jgi:carbamoyltransferase